MIAVGLILYMLKLGRVRPNSYKPITFKFKLGLPPATFSYSGTSVRRTSASIGPPHLRARSPPLSTREFAAPLREFAAPPCTSSSRLHALAAPLPLFLTFPIHHDDTWYGKRPPRAATENPLCHRHVVATGCKTAMAPPYRIFDNTQDNIHKHFWRNLRNCLLLYKCHAK